MTNGERLHANNSELRECIELAEALPDAGTSVEVVLQSKTVTPTESVQEVTADENYTALEKVTVGAIPEEYIVPNGTLEITENGMHDVTEYGAVNVHVESGEGGGGESGLPAGYRRCDYIQFTGQQIVDTGIICNQDSKIQLAFTREKSSQHYLLGVASSDNTAAVTAYFGGNWRFGNKAASKNPTTNADMIYSAVISSAELTISGSKSAISGVPAFETIGTLLLGTCRSSNGEVAAPQFVGKVPFLSILQGDAQAQKLEPVTNGAVYRFYDSVSDEFHDSITDTPLDGGDW